VLKFGGRADARAAIAGGVGCAAIYLIVTVMRRIARV